MNDRIKHLRKMNNLTQIEFSKSIDISQGTLSDIESGSTTPSVDTLIKICLKYNISADWILFGTENEDLIRKKYDKLNTEEKVIVNMLLDKAEIREKEYIKTGNL